MKTRFESYNVRGLPEGCKYCLRGEKLVLFVGGKCSRACWYCSLSNFRKKSDECFANERTVKEDIDLINEAKESNARGAGITGGDPLVYFEKTLRYSKLLKKIFGNKFHIHIYLPLNLVSKEKIKKLEPFIDEFRFHPNFLINKEIDYGEIEKIKMVSQICGKNRVGLELPMMPEKTNDIYNYVIKLRGYVSFLNLNEFEISETNFKTITKKYSLNEDTYTIRNSISEGQKLIEMLKKEKIKIHLCSARTKDGYQYVNRLKKHNIMPYGKRLSDGNVAYFVIYSNNVNKDLKIISNITNKFVLDKNRFILSKSSVRKLYNKTNLKIEKIIEPPVWNADYMERTEL